MTDLDFTCRCGEVRAVLEGASPEAGNHVKCYCRDCQAFMYFCGHEADGLDPAGGSEIYQVKATSVRFSQGADRLAAVRLTGGPLVRWYTTCCKTPVANTPMPGWLDFAGFQVMGLGPEAQLGFHQKPCGALNINAYYQKLVEFLQHTAEEGFVKPQHQELLLVEERPKELLQLMQNYKPRTIDKIL